MKIKTLIAVCVMALALSSCKKEPIKGDKGDTGATGNANVKSITLTSSVGSWAWDGSNYWSSATWTNVSMLSSDVVNNGAVMLYQNIGMAP